MEPYYVCSDYITFGLPKVVIRAENSQEISNIRIRAGAHLTFESGACVCGSVEKTPPPGRFFLCYYSPMVQFRVIAFVVFAAIFASVHSVAMSASLYWYYWWFDIVMHFWGGLLIGLGVHSVTTFRIITLRPTLKLVLATLFFMTISWEIFELWAGLYDPTTYIPDTLADIALGFSGGLFMHFIMASRYNKKI